MNDAVLYRQDGGVGVVTLNRPNNRNSMTPELLDAFVGVAASIVKEPPRCVVITGAGHCFSAGADFKSVTQRTGSGRLPHEASYAMYEPFLSIVDIPVPVIGALNGHAVGGGFGLSLLCDIRIANRDAKYGANFAKLGISPGLAISFTLPRAVGEARAAEMLYSAQLILGTQAAEIGLAIEALPKDQVLSRAMELATEIATSAPTAVRLTKELLRGDFAAQARAAAKREAFAQARTLELPDAAEGIAALLAKRPPKFGD